MASPESYIYRWDDGWSEMVYHPFSSLCPFVCRTEFEGAGLTFCGYMGKAHHRQFSYRHTHVKGHCVVHLGRRRHGADDLSSGERLNLIIWNTVGGTPPPPTPPTHPHPTHPTLHLTCPTLHPPPPSTSLLDPPPPFSARLGLSQLRSHP